MEWIGPIGILVALGLIIFLAMKSYSILIIAPLSALVVIVTNRMDIIGALVSNPDSYMFGMGGFLAKFFLMFLLGAILAKLMEDSGAARSIAQGLLKVTGTDSPYMVMVSVLIVSIILTFGGISLFVAMFAVVPLARPLFKELNIPWHLLMIPIGLGLGTVTMTMLPGTPSIQNIIPTATLGTQLTAAPLLGIVASILTVLFGLWYMKVQLNKCLQAGEGYVASSTDTGVVVQGELPSLFASLFPMIVLIVIIFTGSFMKIPNVILPALATADILAALLLRKYIPNMVGAFNTGALNSVTPAIFTAAAVGFGAVVAVAPGFKSIAAVILGIPGSPLISVAVSTGLFAAITGSASGALGIVMGAFGKTYLAMGANPEAIHRIAAIASGPLSTMPHSGAVLALLALMGLTHKQAYRHLFMTNVVGQLLALIAVLILAIFIY